MLRFFIALVLFFSFLAGGIAAEDLYLFSDPPVPQTACQGEQVLRFGNTWIWQQAPDLQEDETFQLGNQAKRQKVRPKKSSELRSNYIGVDTSGMPRSRRNDWQPLEVVHLIDGDLTTCWLSRGTRRPEMDPPFIQLDFPRPYKIESVTLKKRTGISKRPDYTKLPVAGAVEVGRAMPKEIAILGCSDGINWKKLYKGSTNDTPEKSEWSVSFPAESVKSVRIIADRTVNTENFGYSFSVAEVEIFDTNKKNVASISRGTGILSSSTERGRNELEVMRVLWPVMHETGLKWARIGYHDDPINWHEVEKVKGVLEVDPATDQSITELHRQGINIIMCLNFGNRLYTMPELMKGEKVNRPLERPFPQLWEWYYDSPNPPITEEALQAWERYVEFIVQKYRDRVEYFEIWNEWNISLYWGGPVNVEHYLNLARRTIPIIRRVAPKAKIVAGSTSGFPFECRNWTSEQWKNAEKTNIAIRAWKELIPLVDYIGWHPYYQPQPDRLLNYPDDVRALKKWTQDLGYRGGFMSSEWNFSYNWPEFLPEDAKVTWRGDTSYTEMEKAKYVVQCFLQDTGLDLISCFCELNQPFYGALDLSLFRRGFDSEPMSILQPEAVWYAVRNLSTMTDQFVPEMFSCEFKADKLPKNIRYYTFRTPKGSAVAIWTGGKAAELNTRTPVDIVIPGRFNSVAAMDPVNGVRQQLSIFAETDGVGINISTASNETEKNKSKESVKLKESVKATKTILKGIRIGDSPIIINLVR